jgi:hypothetical protein
MSGTLVNGKLTLDDVMGTGMSIIFYKEGSNPGASANTAAPSTGTGVDALSEAQSWWDGEWYGYWTVTSSSGNLANLKGDVWDCYAVINVKSDGTGMMYIWDDEIDMASVEISIEEQGGVGPMGSATSEGGEAFDTLLKHADWLIVPTYEGYEDYWKNKWYDDYMEFEGTCDTNEGSMDYTIVLRPWGKLWDDIPTDNRPPYYDDWYLHNDFYKLSSVLEALADTNFNGDTAHIHSALGGGAAGGSLGSGGGAAGGAAGAADGASAGAGESSGGGTLSGKYYREDGNYLEFFPDGSCVLYNELVDFKMNGKYTLSGNTITFAEGGEFDYSETASVDGSTVIWKDEEYKQ